MSEVSDTLLITYTYYIQRPKHVAIDLPVQAEPHDKTKRQTDATFTAKEDESSS